MMKRFISILVVALTIFSNVLLSASASAVNNNEITYIYYEDGSVLKICTEETAARASGTKTGKKTYEYVDSNNEAVWTAILYGTFTYNGTTSACTNASCDISIYNNAYSVGNKTVSKSGSTASTNFTMIRKLLGITISQKDYTITLGCDKNGTLS